MSYRSIDLETTGLKEDAPQQGIMEIGWTDMRFDIIKPPQSALVDCGIPVSIQARAIHHISDEMCAGEITPDQACLQLMGGEFEYFCAHNIDHEKQFFGGGDHKWLCTYKTALRIWPDCPGHKLNELRYWLKLDDAEDFDQKYVQRPHRAPDDSYICAHLLRRELKEVTVEQMVRWSSGPALLYMCFLKKHRNKPWHQVAADDPGYLRWIYNEATDVNIDVRATAKYWLNRVSKPSAAGDPYQS